MTGLHWQPRSQSILEEKPGREGRRSEKDIKLIIKGAFKEGRKTAREERTVKECTVRGEGKETTTTGRQCQG